MTFDMFIDQMTTIQRTNKFLWNVTWCLCGILSITNCHKNDCYEKFHFDSTLCYDVQYFCMLYTQSFLTFHKRTAHV